MVATASKPDEEDKDDDEDYTQRKEDKYEFFIVYIWKEVNSEDSLTEVLIFSITNPHDPSIENEVPCASFNLLGQAQKPENVKEAVTKMEGATVTEASLKTLELAGFLSSENIKIRS